MAQWMQCNFIQTVPVWADSVCTFESGGKGDNASRIFKPTGFLDRKPAKEGRKEVSDRVDESAQIQADIAARLAKEFGEETLRLPLEQIPVTQMTLAEVEFEIGVLMRKTIRTQEDELMLVVLMAAAA